MPLRNTDVPRKECPIDGCTWTPDPHAAEMTALTTALGSETAALVMESGAAMAHFVADHPLFDWIGEVVRLRAEVRRLATGSMFGPW